MTVEPSMAGGDSLPVVFFDGEQESSLDSIAVSPFLNFKGLQLIVSERIGISPHQFSIYLADRKRRGSRIPITAKFNFSTISRGGVDDCVFLVVLKRSRRERRRKNNIETIQKRFDPPGNVMLLRRGGDSVAINGVDFSGMGYERRLRELQMQKERYLKNMGLDSGLGFEALSLGFERMENRKTSVACEECSRARGEGAEAGFHWCVHDTVTFGFRSPAGPIARPGKGSG